MRLVLERMRPGLTCTMGDLYVDGVWQCYTLEDLIRPSKVTGETAIPAGTYTVTLENSPKFGPDTLTINDVPGFVGIRIHAGNTDRDTAGCPLVGQRRGNEEIYGSRPALDELKQKVRAAVASGDSVSILIENPEGS